MQDIKIYEKKFEMLHILVPLVFVIIGLWWSTQSFAYNMGYSSEIGKPWFVYNEQPYYYPVSIIFWALKYFLKEEYRYYFQGVGDPAIILSFIGIIIYFFLSLKRGGNVKKNIHGTSRYADDKMLEDNGYFQNNGIVIGQASSAKIKCDASEGSIKFKLIKKSPMIIYNGNTSGILIAPARSGKGISTVIPTFLCYKHSIIAFDPKGEIFNLTAGWRRKFSHVIRFAPLSEESVHYNPLDDIRRGSAAFRDASNIAEILIQKDPGNRADDHWVETAKDCLTGIILHVKFCPTIKEKSLSKCLEVLSKASITDEGEMDCGETVFKEILYAYHTDKSVHKTIMGSVGRILNKPPRERGSVISTVVRCLWLFDDPLISLNTSDSDFTISDFVNSKFPISLYITVPYSDIDRLGPVVRLFVEFFVRRFAEGETQYSKELNNKVLFFLDEAAVLGPFPFLEKAMGILPGFNVTFFLIFQSLQQIIKIHGANHSFFDHCKTVITYAPGDYSSAKMFSDIMGKQTVWKQQISQSGSKYELGKKNISESGSEIQTNLINPDELMRLGHDELIVLSHGLHPYRGKKVVYYNDSRFKNRIGLPAPTTRKEFLTEANFSTQVQTDENKNEDIVILKDKDNQLDSLIEEIEEFKNNESENKILGEELL